MTRPSAWLQARGVGPTFSICAVLSVCLFVMIARAFYWPAAHGLDITGYPLGRDFINNWAGPRIAWSGHLSTLFSLDGYARAIGQVFGRPLPFHNWGYPPFALVLFWPLAQLPYGWALLVWTVGGFAAFAWAATGLADPGRRRTLALALLVAPACLINAMGGQNGFVTGALLLGSLLCLDRRPILAGVLIGLLTLKPQLGLVLPLVLLVLRAWKAIAAACVTAALLVLASLLAFGTEPWVRFVTETSAYQVSLLQHPRGFYLYMMVSVLAQLRLVGVGYGPALLLQGAVSLGVAATTVWVAWRTRDARLRACVVVLATPLITPYAFNYDLTAVAACLTWAMLEGEATAAGRLLFPLAWLLPTLGMILSLLHVPLAPPVLLAVFVVFARRSLQAAPAQARARPVGVPPGAPLLAGA